ncbi:MAG: helix-turn-helix transcriptional regulator [Clostridia bacterium]|nr:helix-turn-helix transcriptional regulator [Clostridia bacterium]
MDQIKIGKFIAECRKNNNLTQMQLAEKLHITDRAVSKWETGKSMPDSSIMLELCDVLGISVNDLLCGEVVAMDNYKEKSEQMLLEMMKQKEESDRQLLSLEILIGTFSVIILLGFTFVAALFQMADWLRVCLVLLGFIIGMIGIAFALRIEQTAGYYECSECHHRYVPTYKSVFWAMHLGRTRYMKCPKCGKRSWQKKVLTKE